MFEIQPNQQYFPLEQKMRIYEAKHAFYFVGDISTVFFVEWPGILQLYYYITHSVALEKLGSGKMYLFRILVFTGLSFLVKLLLKHARACVYIR